MSESKISETKIDENGLEYVELEFTDDDGVVTVSRIY
jgi:hypothetical protein